MITLTENAVAKIKDVLAEENKPGTKLRIFIQGGGCAGFSHGFSLETEPNEDDFELTISDVPVLIDSISSQYLTGATIDYKETLMNSGFTINIPNAISQCGCGASFSM